MILQRGCHLQELPFPSCIPGTTAHPAFGQCSAAISPAAGANKYDEMAIYEFRIHTSLLFIASMQMPFGNFFLSCPPQAKTTCSKDPLLWTKYVLRALMTD